MPPSRKKRPRSKEAAALGQAIRSYRQEQGLSQEELGRRLRVSFRRIGELERGRANPTFKTLARVANGLGIPLSDLFRRYERFLAQDR